MPYILRDAQGVMKAMIAETVMSHVMQSASFTVEKRQVSGYEQPVNAFILTEDYALGDVSSVRFYLWKGDILTPAKPM